MSISIQIDPISVAINGASLLVALLQLYFVWVRRTRDDRGTHEMSAFDQAVEQVCSIDTLLSMIWSRVY